MNSGNVPLRSSSPEPVYHCYPFWKNSTSPSGRAPYQSRRVIMSKSTIPATRAGAADLPAFLCCFSSGHQRFLVFAQHLLEVIKSCKLAILLPSVWLPEYPQFLLLRLQKINTETPLHLRACSQRAALFPSGILPNTDKLGRARQHSSTSCSW